MKDCLPTFAISRESGYWIAGPSFWLSLWLVRVGVSHCSVMRVLA